MKTLTITLGEQIQILRKRAELTQKQLAKHLSMCDVVISQIESGQREVSHSEILAFAQALNIQPIILLNTVPNNGCRSGKVRNKDARQLS
ncbi:helix-turn-helix domain-containing protein [Microcoleus sp. herbarium7]|uniref:helix-turn-helix domain-containing protein n=1 Tax=Microcoleus sp. herbarium7 TaxID=3055435 RepID=UPI003FA600FC